MICRRRTTAVCLALGLLLGSGAACDAQEARELGDAELTAMIDSLLPGIAAASGLEVRRPVRYAMQSRVEARRFIERQLDEELGPETLAGMERSYELLGMLPDTLDLRALLLELLTEQVIGYYDPHTDRLYVVEGAPAATAGPVVAHELVHALQDQHTDLDSLVSDDRGNDRRMAAQAAAEGQAMLVMLALQAAESTGQSIDLGALPDLGPMMRPALEAENSQFPVFQRSPRLIRETLIFPYIAGASFVQALFRNRTGSEVPVPFGRWLPQSTEQVLHPEEKFLGEVDVPTELEIGPAGGGWSVVYTNTLGQLETSILLQERLGLNGDGARGWDGDRYALLAGPDGTESLVWYSVWDDDAAANRIEDALRQSNASIDRLEIDGRPVLRLVVSPNASTLSLPPLTALREIEHR